MDGSKLQRVLGAQPWRRAKLARIWVVTVALMLAAAVRPNVAQALRHGAGSLKGCEPCKEPGQATDCTYEVINLDQFGDNVTVRSAFDTVATGAGNVRVPTVGDLPIIEVNLISKTVCIGGTNSGQACTTSAQCPSNMGGVPCADPSTCTVGGSLPCVLQPGESVVFRSNQYVTKSTDPSPLMDTGSGGWSDNCDSSTTSGCTTAAQTTTAGATTNLCTQDANLCTREACDVDQQSPTFGQCVSGPAKVCNEGDPGTDNNHCTTPFCDTATGNCADGAAKVCNEGDPGTDNNHCTTPSCDTASGNCTDGPAKVCNEGDPGTDNNSCTTPFCNTATGNCTDGPAKVCHEGDPGTDGNACTPVSCNTATGNCVDGSAKTCSRPDCQTCNSTTGNCENIQPPPPQCLPGCRITGGGIACDPTRNPQCVAEIIKATFGGQVGAPCACIGCFDDFDHVQGSWTHNRKQAQGSFHAKDYNSLICGCDGDFTNGLCNPGNRPPGPEPRPAPANMACFSGIGDYALTGGRRTTTVAFRVEVEDRSEPGGTNGTPPPDVYRIRIWIPNPTAGETADTLAAGACCTNASPTGQAARAPNVDDGGSVIRGNMQIHPQTPNSADGRCPIPSGRCTPSP